MQKGLLDHFAVAYFPKAIENGANDEIFSA